MLVKWMMTPRGLAFDRWLVKYTGHSLLNRIFARQAGFPPQPALLLITTGRRSGQSREVALPCFPYKAEDGRQGWLLVGSKGGMPDDPYWVHNLRAQPNAQVIVKRHRRNVRARLAEGEEYEKLWGELSQKVPTYRQYQERAEPHRKIPVVILEPR